MFLHRIQFDDCPTYFWIFGHVLSAAFCLWLLSRKRPISGLLFFSIMAVITGIMRLPVFLFNYEIDPDEAQVLAQGMTLAVDPVIYRSVDPTTGGPLTSYLLAGLSHLGFTLDFQLAHVLGWMLTLAALALVYNTAKYLHLATTVQWAAVPFAAFLSLTQMRDFVHFYSEILSILTLSAGVWFLGRWSYYKDFKTIELVAFGVLMGLLPLCKLQAVPMAFVVGVFALVQIFMFQKQKFVHYTALTIGTILLVWAGWCLILWGNHVLDDFFTYYIKANFQYKDNLASATRRSQLYNFLRLPYIIIRRESSFEWVLLSFSLLIVLFVGVNVYRKKIFQFIKMDAYFWVMILAYLIMTNIAVTRTGSCYPHYFHFFFLPFLLLMSLFLKHLPQWSRWLTLSTQLGFTGPLVLNIMLDQPTNLYTYYPRNQDIDNMKVSSAILKYGKSGDYLAVWGWSCSFYVHSQMPQAVNENHTTRSAMEHSLQSVYLKRYVHDLQRTRAPIFVDAISKKTLWINDRKKYGHERFPLLAHYIADHYTLKEELEDARIYVRNNKGNPAQ